MDLMLALAESEIHEVIWTEHLLSEWKLVIVRERHRTEESAAAIAGAIRRSFPDSKVPLTAYRHLISDMPGDDPDDHHHTAAAVAGGASVIVTWNVDDDPAESLKKLGLRVEEPDEYLCGLTTRFPQEVVMAVRDLADEKRRPPKAPHDLATDLKRAGVPRFAGRLHALLDVQSETPRPLHG